MMRVCAQTIGTRPACSDTGHKGLMPCVNPIRTAPPQARRDVPRAVAAPSLALLVSKSTTVDSVTTWALRLSRDGHIAARGFSYQRVCAYVVLGIPTEQAGFDERVCTCTGVSIRPAGRRRGSLLPAPRRRDLPGR
jgi:hypothetical protein